VISARGFGFDDPSASFACKISLIEAVVSLLHGCLAHAFEEQCKHYIYQLTFLCMPIWANAPCLLIASLGNVTLDIYRSQQFSYPLSRSFTFPTRPENERRACDARKLGGFLQIQPEVYLYDEVLC
jgi:hypothetical protein